MKKLNINEVHTRLLEVADAVDKICSNHDIPLFMVAGTMLGAIRHRGFIPWDDDMDFGVPYEHFYELMGILETELPSRFHCLTYENGKDNLAFHIKVEDHETIARDIRIDKPLELQPGITIDIFPIVCCDEESFSTLIPKIRNVYMVKRRIFIGSTERQNYKKWAKRILPSNPQSIGFSGILLAKRQNSFYCTYFLHNRNVADTKSPYPIKRLEVIRRFNQKDMAFNQSLS